nr:InlB B-repeat-containing protein [Candidatus Enterousia merdequi]
MKRFLCALFCLFVFVYAYADTRNVTWYNEDGTIYTTTTCTVGGDVILPQAPTKIGYTFKGWGTYYKLEYIESTGTQWIDTGYYANNTTVFTLRANKASCSGYVNGTSGNQNAFYVCGGQWAWYSYRDYKYAIDTNSINVFIIKNKQFFINDVLIDQQTSAVPSIWRSPYTFVLFGLKRNATTVSSYPLKIYGASFAEGNTLVHNFIPAQRMFDGAVGLYDTVTQQFFGNSGTGEFIAGPSVGGI